MIKAMKNRMNKTEKHFNSIYGIPAFSQIMEQEVHRTNATDHSFSYIHFDMSGYHKEVMRDVICELKQLVRTTDHIGWVNDEQLGVILPYTPEEGAKLFFRKLKTRTGDLQIAEKTYNYPDNWYDDNREDHQTGKEADHINDRKHLSIMNRAGSQWRVYS